MEDIILIGYGGHAKSVADVIERGKEYRIVGYTDIVQSISQYEYLGTDDNLEVIFNSGIKNAVICVGYLGKGTLREELYARLKNIGFSLPKIIDSSAIVSDSSLIDEGTFIGKRVVVNAEAHIGKCCIINTGAIVEHECNISDFAHISVATVLCGQVTVGKGAFVGANATVIQCRSVPEYTIVPAGEVVRSKL